MDNKLSDTMKKIILAGIGAAAATSEKAAEILDDLVKRGELTVEQGKVLNEELKHNVKKTFHSEHSEQPEQPEHSEQPEQSADVSEMLKGMTPEQLAALKEQIAAMEAEETEE